MLKIPAADHKTYTVPSWSDFKRWINRAAVAYVVLAVACVAGIYAISTHSDDQLKHSINTYAKTSCLNSISKGSVLNKYNDFLSSAIQSRQALLVIDSANGDSAKAQGDEKALARYRGDFAQIPTPVECDVPVLK